MHPAKATVAPACALVPNSAAWRGRPDPAHVSTSYAGRADLTLRMGARRFARLTNAFSKKVGNHAPSVAVPTMHHNCVRVHRTPRRGPAMAAGVTPERWELEDGVKVLEEWESRAVERIG